jgi:hypothetical protein
VTLAFSIPGPFVSGNHAKTREGRRTTASRAFDAKVRMLARIAAREQGWRCAQYVVGTVVLVNVRIDVDNFLKEALDPLQGIVYPFDSRLLDLRVATLRIGKREPHACLSFTAVDGRAYGREKPLRAFPLETFSTGFPHVEATA